MEDEKPPVRRLVLKPREVEPVGKVSRPGDGTAISVELLHRENQLAAVRARRLKRDESHPPPALAVEGQPGPSVFAPREFERIDPPSQPGDESAVTIHDMLHQNAAARGAAPELVAMPLPRKSRRSRDFAAILGMAGLASGVLVVVFRQNVPVAAMALSGIVFVTVILAWIIFGVMDKY